VKFFVICLPRDQICILKVCSEYKSVKSRQMLNAYLYTIQKLPRLLHIVRLQ